MSWIVKSCTKCGSVKSESEFYRRPDRPGLSSQCKPCLGESRRGKANEWNARKRDVRRSLANSLVGDECLLCGYADRLIIHRMDGEAHKPFASMPDAVFLDNLKSGDYVRLCFHCHKGVHFCMDKLGMTWNQVIEKHGDECSKAGERSLQDC